MRAFGVILALSVVALRAWSMPMLTLPSAEVSPHGDTIIPFLAPFDADVPSLPPEYQDGWWIYTLFRFSNWDTRYVDIVWCTLGRDEQHLLGEIPHSSGAPVTFVTLDTPAGMDPAGWGGNGYRVLENEPPRRYYLEFYVSGGRQPLQMGNIWTTGTNHSPMLLVIHGDAIAAAGGTYQLPFMMTSVQFRNAAGGFFDALVNVRSGTFTSVPEPGVFAGLAVGAGGLLWRISRRTHG